MNHKEALQSESELKEYGLDEVSKIAQWVIDNRYPKNENNKVSDFEMYYKIIELIQSLQPKTEEPLYCKEWNNVGYVCEEQCEACKKIDTPKEQPSPSVEKMAEEYDKEEFKRITGHNNHEEMRAYEEGREHEQSTILKWIEKWDGSNNSVLGELLNKKLKANNHLERFILWMETTHRAVNDERYRTALKEAIHAAKIMLKN